MNVRQVRNLLLKFKESKPADNLGLATMLHAIVWRNILEDRNNVPDERILPGLDMVNADLPSLLYTQNFRDQLYDRRFIITFFHFYNPDPNHSNHWVAAVFNRVAATLLIFNILHNANRKARSQVAALA
ncbi:hypothetical protein J3E69DRAFT_372811 [Trichoderma sp. SZMC 28015]